MVAHDLLVRGTDLIDTAERKSPVIRQMHDDDFPARFLQDLLTAESPKISSIAPLSGAPPLLFQPVQRMLNVALIKINCNTLGTPRLDPTRISSAGLVVRRVVRHAVPKNGETAAARQRHAAWMRNAQGQFSWVKLTPAMEHLDPDPKMRAPLRSGDPAVDRQLAAMQAANAMAESTTPAFAAPPATCAALDRTVLYAVIPTASSEVSDTPPLLPALSAQQLLGNMPAMLRSAQGITPPNAPVQGVSVDYRWMNDDALNALYPPQVSTGTLPVTNQNVLDFKVFTQSLRVLDAVFGVFERTPQGDLTVTGSAILSILNRHDVSFGASAPAMGMGDFYAQAKAVLLSTDGYSASSAPPTLLMPTAWDWLNDGDQADLAAAMQASVQQRSQTLIAPKGRFQDNTRLYRLRIFVRLKGDKPECPPTLIWSEYSEEFRIAAWHESGARAHPPVPLPDLTPAFIRSAKPNCSFQVPGGLMNAMQNSSLSGLMNGSAGGGGSSSVAWICGFNIPLITICAFFVLNIFLSLLNIVFFWLPFIKICIPFPAPSSSEPD
jgi:hypothetical protein